MCTSKPDSEMMLNCTYCIVQRRSGDSAGMQLLIDLSTCANQLGSAALLISVDSMKTSKQEVGAASSSFYSVAYT